MELGALRSVAASMGQAADAAGVEIVTGDTRVVEKESGDGLFINTTGIGLVPPGVSLTSSNVRPRDQILLSGTLGDHGIAILSARESIGFDSEIESDSAPLDTLVRDMIAVSSGQIRCLRDPTRGGLASALNEIADRARVGMALLETEIPVRDPVRDPVRAACEMPVSIRFTPRTKGSS